MKKKNNYFKYFLIFIIGLLIGILLMNKFYYPKTTQEKEIVNNDILTGFSNVVAVDSNSNGILGKVRVKITPGEGNILINTNPFLEPDTQYSASIAAFVASNITNINLKNKNVIYDFDIPGQVLGGLSAGVSLTLATISALENKSLKNIGITGTINIDGSIGKVEGILEKGEAVISNNLSLFLIPNGQSIFQYYEPIKSERYNDKTRIISIKYVLKEVNLTEHFKDNYNLTVIEIGNIQDAMKYAF